MLARVIYEAASPGLRWPGFAKSKENCCTMLNNYETTSAQYSATPVRGTGVLAIREVPDLVRKYVRGARTLDYGCGGGRMTGMLESLGLDVTGVDISPHMVEQAKRTRPDARYEVIKSGVIPAPTGHFDLVFSCLVLFEVSSLDDMAGIFAEIRRVLKPGGAFIAVTGSEEMYRRRWLSLDVDYPQNKSLTSGGLAKIKLKNIDLELQDYFWTDADYRDAMRRAGLTLCECRHPTGNADDAEPWRDELQHSPYVVYVMENR